MAAGKTTNRLFQRIGILFLVIGTPFLIWTAVSVYQSTIFDETAVSAEGQVIGFERSEMRGRSRTFPVYAAIIEFSDSKQKRYKFTETLKASEARFERGERVAVLYNPENPSEAVVDDKTGRWFDLFISIPLGLLFVGIGGGLLLYRRNKDRLRKHLLENGRVVMSEFSKVEQKTSLKINGRNPFQVITQAKNPISGRQDQYRSGYLKDDPTAELTGKSIPVFIDPRNSDSYYVDLRDFSVRFI
jgi:hypothetical protein